MTKHTPGPWKTEDWTFGLELDRRFELVIENAEHRIAVLDCDWDGDNPYLIDHAEAHANARLIAAAPDMLKALQDFASTWDDYINSEDEEVDLTALGDACCDALATISKATGES